MPKPQETSKHNYMFSDDIKFLQKCIVFHPTENKFLILKRSPDSFSRPNDWDFPGGNVLFGEYHEESLRREIKPLQVKTDMRGEIYCIFINYTAQATSTEVALSHEHTDYKWISKDEFLKMETADFLKQAIEECDK